MSSAFGASAAPNTGEGCSRSQAEEERGTRTHVEEMPSAAHRRIYSTLEWCNSASIEEKTFGDAHDLWSNQRRRQDFKRFKRTWKNLMKIKGRSPAAILATSRSPDFGVLGWRLGVILCKAALNSACRLGRVSEMSCCFCSLSWDFFYGLMFRDTRWYWRRCQAWHRGVVERHQQVQRWWLVRWSNKTWIWSKACSRETAVMRLTQL